MGEPKARNDDHVISVGLRQKYGSLRASIADLVVSELNFRGWPFNSPAEAGVLIQTCFSPPLPSTLIDSP